MFIFLLHKADTIQDFCSRLVATKVPPCNDAKCSCNKVHNKTLEQSTFRLLSRNVLQDVQLRKVVDTGDSPIKCSAPVRAIILAPTDIILATGLQSRATKIEATKLRNKSLQQKCRMKSA